MLLQFVINGLITGLLYSLLAIGFALVYNTTHIFHIAAAGIYVFAAYMFWWLHGVFGVIAAGVMAIALTMILSLCIEFIVYSPLRRKKSSLSVIMIASIGLMTIIVNFLSMIYGNETKVVENAIQGIYSIGELILTTPQLYQIIFSVITLLSFILALNYTKFGLKIRAVSSDETLFEALGYNAGYTFIQVALCSGLFIGVASCLTIYDVGLDPNMGMTVLINAMVAMIIGGNGRFEACIIGGLLLGVLQSLSVYWFASNWQNAITFAMLLLFLFLRPQGIVGYKQRAM